MAPAGAEPVVLDCGNPRVVAAENPAVPCPTGGAAGGLDAGYPGDEAAFLLSRGEAGKQYYGSPDSLIISVEVSTQAQPLTLKIGYRAYRYGTSACEVQWDGQVVATLDSRAPGEAGEGRVAEVALSPEQSQAGRHLLKLAENSGANGQYAVIDAVAFEGDPQLVLLTPQGRRFVPSPPRPRRTEQVDPSLAFYRERDGAPVREAFDETSLDWLPARWTLAGSGGGVVSFRDGAVYVPTPPEEVHGLASPVRGEGGTFYLARQVEAPRSGVIRLRLKSVFTGDDTVNLASFWHPNGQDKRYFCRFRGHLALSDGTFVHNILPIDDAFHDLKVVYGGGRAQVFCDGRLALANETWPEFNKVCLGHAGAWKGYGLGVAVQSFFVYPRPSTEPASLQVLREGRAVAGQRVRVGIGDQTIEATTDPEGIVELPLRDDVDYPQPISVVAQAEGREVAGRGEVFPGDRWILNLTGKPRDGTPALRRGDSKPVVDLQLGCPEWWLDFGAEGTPVAAGFQAVTPDTQADGRAFGWLEKSDRAAGEFPEADHLLATDLIDVARAGTSVGFEVATPPGEYVVSLIVGSPDLAPEFEVWCEGRSAAAVKVRAGTCGFYSFPASTRDGALTLQFEVGTSLSLAGLIVTPADPTAPAAGRARQLARHLQMSLAAVRALAQGLIEDPPEPEPEPELSEADRARGFVAFPHSYMRPVYTSSRPRPHEVGAPAVGWACPGEYEPILFSLWPLRDLHRCRVEVSDLRAADGTTLPAQAVRVQAVRIWPQRIGPNTFRRLPELIEDLPPEGLELRANETKTFWLTVKTPPDQPPGDYRGTATFTCDASELQVPLWFKVLPIQRASLDDLVMGMYWSFTVSAKRNLETARQQFADMREHGCNSLTLDEPVGVAQTEDGEVFDFSTLDQLLRLYREMGFTAPIPYYGIRAGTERGLYRRLVAALVEEGRKRGWPELLFYPVDEPGNSPAALDLAEELCRLIKAVPGARTYITLNGRGVDAARLDPWLDVRCYQHLSYNPDEARKTKEAGDLLWFYTGPPSSILITRLNEGLWWYRSEMTAHFYWHYCWPVGDPWDDFDGAGDYCAAYPGDHGPIATLGWEGVREGLDDLRYFRTLEADIQRARERGVAPALADEAEKYLRDLCQRIPADGAKITEAREAIAPEEYVAIRWRVARFIVALEQALHGRTGRTITDDQEFEARLLPAQEFHGGR